MQELAIFKNEEFGRVRIIDIDDKPWFVAKDIALALGYIDTDQAIRKHCKKANNYYPVGSTGVTQPKIIPESDVYRLIANSQLPSAEKFQDWLFEEVLPSIGKHGAYMTPDVLAMSIANPDYMIGLLQALKETQCKLTAEQEQRALAENKNAILMHVRKTYTATEVAKELGLRSATELNRKLSALKVQYQANGTWVPYADYADCGYFEIKQEILDNGKTIYHRRITQLGREMIVNLLSSSEG